MANIVIVKNSLVAKKRPPKGGKPGELWVNIVDKVIGSFDAAGVPFEFGVASDPPPEGHLSWGGATAFLSWGSAKLFWGETFPLPMHVGNILNWGGLRSNLLWGGTSNKILWGK